MRQIAITSLDDLYMRHAEVTYDLLRHPAVNPPTPSEPKDQAAREYTGYDN